MSNTKKTLSKHAVDSSTEIQPTYDPEEESKCCFNNYLNSLIDSETTHVIDESTFVVDNENDSHGDDLGNAKRTRIEENDDIPNCNVDADEARISHAINSSTLAAGVTHVNDQAINPSNTPAQPMNNNLKCSNASTSNNATSINASTRLIDDPAMDKSTDDLKYDMSCEEYYKKNDKYKKILLRGAPPC